jgi:hypothetical protein
MDGAPNLEHANAGHGENELPPQPLNERKRDLGRFADFPFQFYRNLWMERDMDEEGPFKENIHEDFEDIYGDLSYGLQLLQQGDEGDAVRYWRDSYFRHWGHHASAAIWAMDFQLGQAKKDKQDEVAISGAPCPLPWSAKSPMSNDS